ncbi:alpha/beta fold hydrolase [Jiangella alkaliphila]|uniref:Lysophospholipase, alpha-beta hydrolase superfamily n=1 Tax=Jiangella alkaliphila TaxID=419479 RepID=A0A1H2L9S4_9ACTN|nr:alpha/beta hydrolase [Jiangella alkaliphila]SDU77797.1 Lysophospholipase, alpha-beta hydrolase superfamily [Jiangella alkaliphila]
MTEYVTTALGDRVAFDRYGDGPGLIFVAGAGPFRAIDPITTETAELAAKQGLATIVYDRIGRGDSETTTTPIGLDRELAAIRALMDVLGGGAALCGHSSGCSISLAAAANGLPVTALALWEAPIAPVGTVAEWIGEVERRMDAGDLEGALAHYMKDMPPVWLEESRNDPMYPEYVAQVVSYRADGESLVWADSGPQAELFAGVRVPVQYMYGTETFDEMHVAAKAVLAAIPGSVEKELPGAFHSWEPAPMAAELARFTRGAGS